MKYPLFIIGLIGFSVFFACRPSSNLDENNSTPTSGKLIIGVDETLKPMAEAEIKAFTSIYRNSQITPYYSQEKEIIEQLISNEIQTALICRELNYAELDSIHKHFMQYPKMFKIGTDGMLFIVNSNNPVKTISITDIGKILGGSLSKWKEISPEWKDVSEIIPVTTPHSSISRYLSYLNDTLSPLAAYQINTTTDVLTYVQNNRNALGIIGGSWLLQRGGELEGVKLVAHTLPDTTRTIPELAFYREVFVVTQEPFYGLGNGFIAFLASDRGQLVLLKEGMLPYKTINREFELAE
jgi:phosphate transport system substrate-binding protein